MATFCQEGATDFFIAPEKAELKFFTCKEGILNGESIRGVSTLAKGDIHYPYLVLLDTAGSQVLIFDKNKGFETPIRTIQNPKQFAKWGAIKFLNDSIIAVGHMYDSAKLSIINTLNSQAATYVGPDSIFLWKGIDDILLDGTTLWAVDDMIMPLYILEYQIGKVNELTLKRVHSLKPNGTYESIKQALFNDEYIVYLSNTGGGNGSYYPSYITFIRKSETSISATLEGGGYSKRIKTKGSKGYWNMFPFKITSIAKNSEYVFYSKPDIGLGIIPFENVSPSKSQYRNVPVSSNSIKEIPMKNLVKVIWLPNNAVLAGVFYNKGGYEVSAINY